MCSRAPPRSRRVARSLRSSGGPRHLDEPVDPIGGFLVTRYEGQPEAPTAFLVNDPDLGGELRCTPKQLEAMGAGSGNLWMVHQ